MSKEQVKRNEEQRIRLEAVRESLTHLPYNSNNNEALLSILINIEVALAINAATDKLYDISEELFHIQLGIRESK